MEQEARKPYTIKKLCILLILLVAILGKATKTSAENKLDFYLDKLAYCESGKRSDIKILDSNQKYSYGFLQFQESTFINYSLKYNLFPNAEQKEIMNFIYDSDAQIKLAKRMLEDDKSNWRHWKICGERVGLAKWLNSKPSKE